MHWRLLRANQILQQPYEGIAEASRLYSEIASRRPRWSQGLVLGGRVSAARGDPRRAAELFRRALAEGERHTSTVLLLVQSLNRVGDVAAAETELSRLEHLTDSVGQISTMAVGLALRQGNFSSALQRARDGVASRPDDSQSLLLLAQAAIAAARVEHKYPSNQEHGSDTINQQAVDKSHEVNRLREEARSALQRALKASRGKNLGIWLAQFHFQLETEGHAAARNVLKELGNSKLPEDVRFLAAANGYLTIKDFAEVRVWLKKARKINPSNPMVALSQAKLARATSDDQGLVDAYEDAYRLAPHEDAIRRRLAIALAVTATDAIPWSRIEKLIGPDRPDNSYADRLYRSLIMINRGQPEQVEQAKIDLRQVIQSGSSESRDDAIRLLLSAEKSRPL